MSLDSLPIRQLLQSYNALEEEFIIREMMKKHGDVVGGYTERLICHALGLRRLVDNTPRFDAVAPNGDYYQIKGRRHIGLNAQFGKFATQREERKVDFFVGVVFTYDFLVRFAVSIPYAFAEASANFNAANHAFQLTLSDEIRDHCDVKNITGCVLAAQETLVIDRPSPNNHPAK